MTATHQRALQQYHFNIMDKDISVWGTLVGVLVLWQLLRMVSQELFMDLDTFDFPEGPQ